jgi:phage baseplate assembly protein W
LATDFGSDVSAIPDLDPAFTLRTGARVLGEALARRLMTPSGSLFYDPDYGLDLRAFLNESFTPRTAAKLQTLIAAEVQKDPRVASVAVVVTFNPAARTMRVQLSVEADAGPFQFVLGVDAVTVALLQAA